MFSFLHRTLKKKKHSTDQPTIFKTDSVTPPPHLDDHHVIAHTMSQMERNELYSAACGENADDRQFVSLCDVCSHVAWVIIYHVRARWMPNSRC